MFGDIGIGILLSLLFTHLFGVEFSYINIIFGIIFSLLPDIDMLVFVHPWFKKVFGNHRDVSHYPILYIPLALIVYLFFGLFWATFLFTAVIIHLIHDTLWIGTGIRWFWPFSKKSYMYFSQDYKVTTNEHWFKAFYGHLTLVSVVECGIFIFSLLYLYIFFITN